VVATTMSAYLASVQERARRAELESAEDRARAEEAQAKAQVLALRVLAERLEHGEARPVDINISVPTV
jgi:hypothetical protein